MLRTHVAKFIETYEFDVDIFYTKRILCLSSQWNITEERVSSNSVLYLNKYLSGLLYSLPVMQDVFLQWQ
jgi:hypothetical protein